MNTFKHVFTDSTSLSAFLSYTCIVTNASVLVQIFTADSKEDVSLIHDICTDYFENPLIIGVLTPTYIQDGAIVTNGTVVHITELKTVYCAIFHQTHNEFNELHMPNSIVNQPNNSYFIQLISTITVAQNKLLIQSLKELLPECHINGGILTDESLFYYNGSFFNQGYIGIVFYSSKLHHQQFSTTSVIPIGREHTITKCSGHVIERIDDIPAKQFYLNYLGKSDTKNSDSYLRKFPLILTKKSLNLPTPISNIDDTNFLRSSLLVQTGDIISLGYGDINYYINELALIHQYLPSIPCQYFLGFLSKQCTLNILEHTMNHQLNLPITGLLTNFEFVDSNFDTYIACDYTTLSCLATNQTNFLTLTDIPTRISLSPDELEHSVLLKLVENTSKELNALNHTLESIILDKTNELLDHFYTDQLTHLPNINRLIEDIDNDKTDIRALCLIDISAFININNFYGSRIGNKVLREFAQLLTTFSDMYQYKIYRVHADIFAIANFDASYRSFSNRMRILQTSIHKHCFIESKQRIFINTTFAISNINLALYENTSMTLQHAKSEKITYLMYDETLNIEEAIINNLTWTSKIRTAIDNDRIVPFFQPIYNNKTESIDRFEVLMRLIDEDGNIISPYTFLPIAKKAGLYDKLTQIIIKKTFEYFEDKPYKFSINLSAEDITNPKTRSYIYNRLVSFSKPHHVIFEIVESESIENYELMIAFIAEIKRQGAEIAIDDFGTGFSNFHYLFKLNIDCIKIDGSIIQEMQHDSSALIVAETIVSFANKMGITTVAEYVSDEKIFKQAQSLGIDFSQGYFVAQPAAEIVM